MSDNHDSDEILLPDDADKKIDELLAALRESEEKMNEGTATDNVQSGAADGEPESESAEEMAVGVGVEDDLFTDDEGDFVDLDAEQLDNSADMLRLDESDSLEEHMMEELSRSQAAEEQLDTSFEEQQRLEAEERVAARINELEEELSAVTAAQLQVPAPVTRPTDTLPAWLSPTLAFLALLMSGAALWFSQSVPQSVPSMQAAVTDSSDKVALQSLKVDFASLRERFSAMEKRAEAGDEAVALLERMQGALVRMEQQLLSRDAVPGVSTTVLQPLDVAPVVVEPAVSSSLPITEKAQTKPVAAPSESAEADMTDQSAAITSKAVTRIPATTDKGEEPPAGKVFIKGWAVNLRSYYYQIDAERLVKSYQRLGIDAEIREIAKGSATWYRVRVKGFASKKEANDFIEGLSLEQGREVAWPSYYQGFVDG